MLPTYSLLSDDSQLLLLRLAIVLDRYDEMITK